MMILTVISMILFSQPHLDVEGNSKIRGNIDLNHGVDSTSMFVGRNAHVNYFNGTSRNNTIVGVHSAFNPNTGDNAGTHNSIFGFDAGRFNSGSFTAIFGAMAGALNKGPSNNFFGYSSGFSNTFGAANAFYGHRTGFNNEEGSNNSFFGYQAGSGNSDGASNTFIGANAGQNNALGSNNTYVGAGAAQLTNGDQIDNSIALGNQAKVDCSNCAVIGGTGSNAVKVGIGIAAPSSTLHVHETNNTRLKISNENSKDIFFDLIRNDAGKADRDWRVSNTSQGDFAISSHATDLEGNAPSLVIQLSPTSLIPGTNSMNLGQSGKRWKEVWASVGSFSQLVALQPTSEPFTCDASTEGSIYFDKTTHKLRVCGLISTSYKWQDLN